MQHTEIACCPYCHAPQPPSATFFDEKTSSLVSGNVRVQFNGNQLTVVRLLWQTRHLGPVSRERIHNHIYGHDPNGGASERIVDVILRAIRRKLEVTDLEIVNVWGIGWRFKRRRV
jgi:DNA-binding response OmpR family regulator